MKIVLGGKFESSLIRNIDSVIQPDRNVSTHSYYVGLNRYVAKSYFERAATFVALADSTLVPEVDWNYPYRRDYRGSLAELDFGIERDKTEIREWDYDTRKFVGILLKNRVLSSGSWLHVSGLSLIHYDAESRKQLTQQSPQLRSSIAEHYLCRLFLQLNVARHTGAFAVLSEEDLAILQEVVDFVSSRKLPTPFDLPALEGRLIDPDKFGDGILNFDPPDMHALAAVRADSEVIKYKKKVSALLAEAPNHEREQKLLSALVEAHERSVSGRKAEKVIETAGWVLRPLHYIPGVDAMLAVAEDAKDLGMKWFNRGVSNSEWHLLGVRMKDVAVRDYLSRKANLIT